EIVALQEFDADLTPAIGIETAIDDAGFGATAAIAAAKNNRTALLDRMVAQQPGAMSADGERPGFLFPGAAGILAAKPKGNGRCHAGAAAETRPELRRATQKILEAAIPYGVAGMIFMDEVLGLIDAGGQKNLKRIHGCGVIGLVFQIVAASLELLNAD